MCSGGEGNSSQKWNDTVSQGKGPFDSQNFGVSMGLGARCHCGASGDLPYKWPSARLPWNSSIKTRRRISLLSLLPPTTCLLFYLILLLDNVNVIEATITNESTLMSIKRHVEMRLPRLLCTLRLQKLKNPSTKFKSLWLVLWRGRQS